MLKLDKIKLNLSRPIQIQDLVDEYEKLIANDHISDEFEVRSYFFEKTISFLDRNFKIIFKKFFH